MKSYTFGLVSLLIIGVGVSVDAAEATNAYGNIVKNPFFMEKDVSGAGRKNVPTDWNLGDSYNWELKELGTGGSGTYKGKALYSYLYWRYTEPTGIVVSTRNNSVSLIQNIDRSQLDFSRKIFIGGTVTLGPGAIESSGVRAVNPGDFHINMYAGSGENNGSAGQEQAFTATLNSPNVTFDSASGNFLMEVQANDKQKLAFEKNDVTLWFKVQAGSYGSVYGLDNVFVSQMLLDPVTEKISVSLGESITQKDVENKISQIDIVEGDERVTAESFTIDGIAKDNSILTNRVGNGNTMVNVTAVAKGNTYKGMVKIPTEVTWGDSIAIGDHNRDYNEGVLALTLKEKEDGLKIMGTFSKWLDATTNIIPKTNTFMMMKMQDTSVSDVKGLTHEGGRYRFSSGEAKVSRSLIYRNVGYVDGTNVHVRVTMTPNEEVTDLTSNFIGYETGFMNIGVKSKKGKPIETAVSYEFLNDDNQLIKVSGYWTVTGLNQYKRVALPSEQVENIYSYHRGTSPQTTIKYLEEGDNLTLIGTNTKAGSSGEGVETTLTYNALETFDFTVIPRDMDDTIQLNYSQSSIPKVGIPDSQPVNQTVKNITKDNRDKLTNEFVQHIPFESTDNRDQDMTWTLSE